MRRTPEMLDRRQHGLLRRPVRLRGIPESDLSMRARYQLHLPPAGAVIRGKIWGLLYTFTPLTVILIIISFPSPTHFFIPGLNLPFLQIFPTAAFFFFFRTDYMIPQTITVTSEHIRFYYLVIIFCFTLFSCRFRAVD